MDKQHGSGSHQPGQKQEGKDKQHSQSGGNPQHGGQRSGADDREREPGHKGSGHPSDHKSDQRR